MRFHVITIFPHLFDSYLADSIIGRAINEKKIEVLFYNPRDYSTDKHRKVDQRSYGGGPGMVMHAEPILRACEVARGKSQKRKYTTIIFSPGGDNFTNTYAMKYAKSYTDIIMICGRYEGIDARVKKILRAKEISIGDYVLTGGEIPALVVIDATARQIKGVLGHSESVEEKRNASHEVYTRPEVFLWKKKKYVVPKVLISGNHKDIEAWRGERGEKAGT